MGDPVLRIPRRGKLVLATMVGVIATMLAPSAASAAYYGAETDYSSRWAEGYPDYDSYGVCRYATGVDACFQSYGDRFWVWDELVNGKPDGYSAAVEWRDVDGTRSGTCVNNHGSGVLGDCNKIFVEGHRIFWRYARYNAGVQVNAGAWVESIA
jgi:hypothetical protein